MSKLRIILDKITVDKDRLKYLGKNSSDAAHKVLLVGNGASICGYAAPTGHVRIVKNNKLDSTRILGGFNFYINAEENLVFEGCSLLYGGVPKQIADRFARLIQKELKKLGINGKDLVVNPKIDLSHKWLHYGFEGLDSKLEGK